MLRYIGMLKIKHPQTDRIGGVIIIVLALSAIHREFEPRSSQTKD